ncbi:hypothetical protein, partial [Streptomyces sp. NPDC006333]|uniref:hypothetical protein n=1 Tax=Streptomyces sp. NPDC006333 TaxID=3156753 RepID=UPI00339EAFFB
GLTVAAGNVLLLARLASTYYVVTVVPAAPTASGHHPTAESRFTLCFALAGGAFAPVAALPRFGVSGSLSDSASYRPSDAAGTPAPEPVRRP